MRGGLRSSGVESFRPAGEHWFRRQGAFRVQLRQRSDLTNVRSGPLCGLKSDISRGPRSARLGHRQIIRSPSSVSASNVGEAPKQWGELPVAIWLPVLRQVEQKALVERSAFRRAVRVHARPLKAMESPGCPIANSPIILLLCCYRAGAFPQRLGDGNVVSSLIAWMRVTTRLRSFRSLEAPVPSGFCGPRLEILL